MTRRSWWRAVGLVLVIALVVLLVRLVGAPDLEQLRSTFGRLGPWAGVVFAAGYAVATLSPLPKTVFTLAAGAMFGLPAGLIIVLAGANVGALAGFGLGRALGRDTVRSWLGPRTERWEAELTKRGFAAVLVARLIPVVPFTAVNYLAGLTEVRLRDFTLGTAVGIIPATTAYVTVGAYGTEPGSWPFLAALGALALLTLAGLLGAWHRRRTGRTAQPPEPSVGSAAPGSQQPDREA